ncbi:uncharacterized protein [Pocillopora verrucosa]|uniref:uncharacterized protein n=1 Tax=Pocillopora verrucosa TaxID=203993 RepID=UPI003340B6A6
MENEKAEAWLRQSADFKEDTSSKESLLTRFSRHVIMPDSWFAVIWERLLVSVLLFICFVYTFVASFSISLHALGYGEGIGSKALMSFTYLLDAVLVADFIMRFNMASGTTTEIEDIRKSYRRSLLFWIDLLAILPIEIFALSQDDHHKIWHSLAFLRLNRLIKAVRIPRFFSNLENNLHYNIGKVRAVKFTIYIILITHISACVWFLGACFRETCTEGSWAQHTGNTHRIAGFGDYISSLYWAAATMSSTGYGDIHAHNMESQLIATVVMLTGLLLYGYCLSSIAATLANSAAPKVEFFARMTATQEFMAEQNLSRHLMERTETYLTMLWRVHRGEATPGGRRLIEDMPLSLQMDVTYEETKDYLEKVPIFMETDAIFLRELSLKVTSYLFSPGDYIVYAGDMGREMYCVRRGLVEVIADDDKGTGEATVVATLGPGAYFGEIGLIFGENRLATVKAKTFCEILMLTKPDLDEVLVRFPIVARQIYDAGVNSDHVKDVRQAAFESTKAAVRRLSMKCANQERSSVMSKSQTSKKKKEGRVSPELSAMRTGFMSVTNESKEDVNKPYNDLHPIFWLFSRLLMRHSISPDSHYFVMWQGLSLVIAGIFTFTLTLQAAFLHTATSLWIVNYCFDFLCLVDMYIKFHLAFYNENNVLVTHPIYTARNYLRKNFPLDLLCSFPTDIIVLAIWPVSLGVLRILALARLNRCLYMYKTLQFFHFMTNSIGKNINLLGQLKVALYMATFTHCIACGWFLLACKGLENGDHSCAADSWVEQGNRTLATNSFGEQYITSLYWAAATSASVGYGDIHAYNTTEMTFALFCMIIGIVFYGYIIASVAASLANADAQRARYQERLDAIKTFLEEQEISEKLTTRVISYYEYLWLRNKGIDASSLFEGLPLALQADISVSLYKDMIERVPLFEGTEIGFLKMLSMKMKPVYFLAKEYIVRKGDIGQEMYFIHRGTVEVVSEHDEPIVFDTMGEGRFFGEISVVFSCPRTASIRTQKNSDVFMLTKKDLDEVLSHYPQIRKKILETAEERQRMVAERAKAFAKKKEEDKKREEENKLKEQEEGHNDQASLTLQIEEPAEPTPTTGQRILTNLWNFKARLTELFVHFVILPNSKWRLIKYVNCVFVFATTLTITYMAAFQDHPWYLITFNYLCEFSFYAEIYLNFNMAYTNNIGEVISDGRTLLINYAKGKLPLDSLASFPIDIFALAAPADEQLFVLSYLRLLHLIRVVRMQQFFSELAQRLNIDVFRVRMTKFVFQLVIVIHVFACAWYGLACPLNDCSTEENWIKLEDLLDAPALSRYCTAVYWVVATMTSTGYGDIHGDSSSEMALASFVMIFGKLLFGFILGNIASTLANAEIRRVKYEEKLDAIQAHMSDQDIPEALQNRVMDFYEFIWNKNKGIDHGTLFYDMPLCMNGELCLGIVKDILYAVPFLENTELPFIRLLSTKVKPANFHASEYIVRKGDIGQEMFIIRKGLVEVVTEEDPPEVIETLEKGDYFGEMFLIHACPQKMSLRAVTHVDMLLLSKEDLDALLVHDLHVAKQVSEVAERLYPNPSKTK